MVAGVWTVEQKVKDKTPVDFRRAGFYITAPGQMGLDQQGSAGLREGNLKMGLGDQLKIKIFETTE